MSDTPENHDALPYQVGYCRPPRHSRFQKGCRSPNPRGRPRKEFSFVELIREELNRRINVRENGKTITMTIREAWLRRIVGDAIQGKPRAQRIFVKIARPTEAWLGESGRKIFYLIDSQYTEKRPKPEPTS